MSVRAGIRQRQFVLVGVPEADPRASKLSSALVERGVSLLFPPGADSASLNQTLWSLADGADCVVLIFDVNVSDDAMAMSLLGIASELRKPIVVLAFGETPSADFLAALREPVVHPVLTIEDAVERLVGKKRPRAITPTASLIVGAVLVGVVGVASWLLLNQRTISADRRTCFEVAGSDLSLDPSIRGVAFGYVSPASEVSCDRAIAREGEDGALRFAYARALRASDNVSWRRQMLQAARGGDTEAALLAHYPGIGATLSGGDATALQEAEQDELERLARGSILTLADAARRGSPDAAVMLARYADVVFLMLDQERNEVGPRGPLHAALGFSSAAAFNGEPRVAHPPHVMRWLGQASAANFAPALYEGARVKETGVDALDAYEPRSAEALLRAAIDQDYGPALHAQGARLVERAETRLEGLTLLRSAAGDGYRPAMITLSRALIARGDAADLVEARAVMERFTDDFQMTAP